MLKTRSTLAAAFAASGFIAALGYAAAPPKVVMNVEPGLWEVTTHPEVSGAPVIPDSLLQRLTPEQRAKMEAALAKGSQPRKFKECMTKEKLARGFGSKGDEGDSCKDTVTTNTATEFAAERHCAGDGGKSRDSKIHFRIESRHQTSGTVDLALTQEDGKVSNVHSRIEAQWLGADCGNVKDIEVEK